MIFTTNEIFILIGIVLIASELFVGIQTGFDLVLVGIALIIGGTIGLLTTNPIFALIISSLLLIFYFIFGRSFVKQKVFILTKKTNIDKLIGETGVVIRSITPDTAGMVRIDDEDWRATSSQILYEKDKIKVEAIEGVTLCVTKIK